MGNQLRITGLATGLDVDSMVKQMMSAEKVKVDKLLQNKQIVQWKQDMYRDIIGDLNTFKSTYFDVLKPDNYMLSSRNYSSFDILTTLASTGANTSAVTATATNGAVAGNYTVNVKSLAQKASVQGSSRTNVKEAIGSITFPIKITAENDELTVGGTKIILNQKTYSNLNELVGEVNSKISTTVDSSNVKLSEKYKAVVRDGKISFDKLIKINNEGTSKNNQFVIDTGTGSPETVVIDKGNYTIEELANLINSKVTTLPAGYKISMSEPTVPVGDTKIQKLVIKESNGNEVPSVSIKSNNGFVTTDFATVSSEEPVSIISGQITVSDPDTVDNKLSYKKSIINDVNDTLIIKAGGSDPVFIDLKNILKNVGSKTDEEVTQYIVDSLNTEFNNKSLGVSVSKSQDGKLLFKTTGAQQINISGNGTSTLGLSSSFNIDQTVDDKMSNLISGKVKFTINNATFNYDFSSEADKNKSIKTILDDISAKANVNISYSQLTRQFNMTSKNTGADQSIIAYDWDVSGSSSEFLNSIFGVNKLNLSSLDVKGKFELTLSESLKEGDSITIGTETYTATSNPLNPTDFALGSDLKNTILNLASKINAVDSASAYTAVPDVSGKIILTQKLATNVKEISTSVTDSGGVIKSVANVSTLVQGATRTTIPTDLDGNEIGNIKSGKDASVEITDPSNQKQTIYKSFNDFTLDGVSYTLNEVSEVKIKLTSNPQNTFDKVKAFVDKYNEIIDKISTKLFEKKQYDYKPLTDEQKKDMKEDEIKIWEAKVKEGLLANDSTLSNMLYSIRSAFYESVRDSSGNGIGVSLTDIGIKTSSDVGERGKLTIDETKLKAAIQNNGDKVMQLFTKTSTSVPSYSPNLNSVDREKRYKELGVFQRISDILQDNLRTIRDNTNKKGILLEKAGIKGDFSEFSNLLTEDILRKDKVIKEMTSKLADKENRYYLKFSKLETAMQQLNNQSSWLTSQLGSTSG
jgi:flagellar hook-associated protein 2